MLAALYGGAGSRIGLVCSNRSMGWYDILIAYVGVVVVPGWGRPSHIRFPVQLDLFSFFCLLISYSMSSYPCFLFSLRMNLAFLLFTILI